MQFGMNEALGLVDYTSSQEGSDRSFYKPYSEYTAQVRPSPTSSSSSSSSLNSLLGLFLSLFLHQLLFLAFFLRPECRRRGPEKGRIFCLPAEKERRESSFSSSSSYSSFYSFCVVWRGLREAFSGRRRVERSSRARGLAVHRGIYTPRLQEKKKHGHTRTLHLFRTCAKRERRKVSRQRIEACSSGEKCLPRSSVVFSSGSEVKNSVDGRRHERQFLFSTSRRLDCMHQDKTEETHHPTIF